MTQTCRACYDYPVTDTFVCTPCIDQLYGDLHATVDLARELGIEAAKRVNRSHGPATFSPTVERPLPVNLAAAAALDELRFNLVAACLDLALGDRNVLPADTIGGMAGWLVQHESTIALRESGGDICRSIRASIQRGRRVIDNPPERIYIGKCTCVDSRGEHPRLYARAGQQYHECRGCHTLHDAEAKREGLQAELADHGLTRKELKALLPKLPPKTLDNWIDRSPVRLPQLGTTAEGEPTYRYGDVLALDARRREYGTRRRAS